LNSFPDNPEAAPESPPEPLSNSQPSPVIEWTIDSPVEPRAIIPTDLIPTPLVPKDPYWLDFFVLLALTVVSIVILGFSLVAAVLIAKKWFYPHLDASDLEHMPLIPMYGQAAGYLLVLAFMYFLVTRVQHRPNFLTAIHWNWPSKPGAYLFAGVVLSIALQGFAHLLPIPKNLPIDNMFRTPSAAWVLAIFSITFAPLMEELYFRGFLYPVLERYIGFAGSLAVKRYVAMPIAILLTAAPFALLHGFQLEFAWGPVLVIFLVGLVLTIVRAYRDSVAATLLMHVAYNGTITLAMFAATNGFRHLEKLNP
jgi:membrane protease YdiL (CAAX protease family)